MLIASLQICRHILNKPARRQNVTLKTACRAQLCVCACVCVCANKPALSYLGGGLAWHKECASRIHQKGSISEVVQRTFLYWHSQSRLEAPNLTSKALLCKTRDESSQYKSLHRIIHSKRKACVPRAFVRCAAADFACASQSANAQSKKRTGADGKGLCCACVRASLMSRHTELTMAQDGPCGSAPGGDP